MATLREVRVDFVDKSGRFDLVQTVLTDDYVDNGANDYINEAMRELDRVLETPQTEGRFVVAVAADEYRVSFQGCRAVYSVWFTNDDDGRTKLIQQTMEELRERFPADWEESDSSSPAYWAPGPSRLSPELYDYEEADLEDLNDVQDVDLGDTPTLYDSLVFMPPTESAGTITVWGLFNSLELSDDDDVNYWTVRHPKLLRRVAQYFMECDMRNTSGQRDWRSAFEPELLQITHDTIDQRVHGVHQMKG